MVASIALYFNLVMEDMKMWSCLGLCTLTLILPMGFAMGRAMTRVVAVDTTAAVAQRDVREPEVKVADEATITRGELRETVAASVSAEVRKALKESALHDTALLRAALCEALGVEPSAATAESEWSARRWKKRRSTQFGAPGQRPSPPPDYGPSTLLSVHDLQVADALPARAQEEAKALPTSPPVSRTRYTLGYHSDQRV
jgi:hypothetical protein